MPMLVTSIMAKSNHSFGRNLRRKQPSDTSHQRTLRYKPSLYVPYGCHPYPAVQADGSVSAGLKGSGPDGGECGGSALGSQVYYRSDWCRNKWAIMYAWYLPKAGPHSINSATSGKQQ
ncbi:hypothetical protein PPTG_07690 [Phytophthora nicotianae INRA-310]|uniref:Uncharacterized protein n=1 Tax=Phytophthora nicotianae (strain INRA-310) TaxID=761204 RepID=W2QQA2_PHYN3|nr:hypothetical protein PPTG_07690 [Phytophthora nicotianae INRA-310]ETN14699.1 hypothetical protein PPTG_07690 [Phytophthora nicotianae INRA-310]